MKLFHKTNNSDSPEKFKKYHTANKHCKIMNMQKESVCFFSICETVFFKNLK